MGTSGGFTLMKECTKCGKIYPANLDYFHRDNTKPDRLHSWCKNCKQESDRNNHKKNYQNNKESKLRKVSERREKIKTVLGIRLTTIHDQMKKVIQKPSYCLICNQNKQLDLASINHTYTNNPNDWIWLCRSCHTILDKEMSEKSVCEMSGTHRSNKESSVADSTPSEPIFMEGNCIYKMECENVSKTCHLECDRYHKFDLREFIDYIYREKEPTDDFIKVESKPYWLIPKDVDDFLRNYPSDGVRIKYDKLLGGLPEKAELEQMIDCCEEWFYNGIPSQSDIEDLNKWKKKYLEDADESET